MLRISQEALTFDDILLVPGYSEVLPNEVSLKTRLTRGIELNIPLVSAAMDTVTEARLAIAMAQEGGIGIIHKNMTIEQQAAEVRKVKKFEAGVVRTRSRSKPMPLFVICSNLPACTTFPAYRCCTMATWSAS